MVDVDGTLASLFVDPSREQIMRSVTLTDGVVVTAGNTVALIH